MLRTGPKPSTVLDSRLRQLLDEREPGQVLGAREIARFCGCHHSLIGQIEQGAMKKLRQRLECLGVRGA